MMKLRSLVVAMALAGAAGWAAAAAVTVFDTSLAAVNGVYGAGVATTGAAGGGAQGTVTTVTGPGGGANRANAAPVADQWVQRGVGGNGTVGITDHYARSGNGSAYFAGTGATGSYKGDLELYFGTAVSLSSVTGLSYDWIRDSASGAQAHLHPALRLIVAGTVGGAPVGGYLVFEEAYNRPVPATTAVTAGSWVSEDVIGANFWSTGNLPGAFSVYNRDLTDWLALVSDLTVVGLSFGIGSGFNGGDFTGAVDNVSFSAGGVTTSWNFEVAGATGTVPEPTTLALVALGLTGALLRRRGLRKG